MWPRPSLCNDMSPLKMVPGQIGFASFRRRIGKPIFLGEKCRRAG